MTSPSDKITQAERKRIITDEARANKLAATLHGRAQAEADNVRGRFAPHEQSTITGADPSVQYPALPPSSWSNQLAQATPAEPSLGFSVEEAPIVGEWFEVQASLDAQNDGPDELITQQGSTPPAGARANQRALLPPAGSPSNQTFKRKI